MQRARRAAHAQVSGGWVAAFRGNVARWLAGYTVLGAWPFERWSQPLTDARLEAAACLQCVCVCVCVCSLVLH